MTSIKHLIRHQVARAKKGRVRYADGGAAFGTLTPQEEAEVPPNFLDRAVSHGLGSLATLPKRAIDASTQDVQHLGDPDYRRQSIAPAVETAMTMTGGAGVVPAEANTLRAGIKAYHGSPHDFDRFDLSKIGTGEGAQSYGHGLYFAENPSVAEGYRDKLAAKNPGHMYEVNINADPAQFLDWEKQLKAHTPETQDALKQAMGIDYYGKFDPQKAQRAWDTHQYSQAGTAVRQGHIAFSDEHVARRLNEAGIPGIKYLDQGSRGAGEGSRNYVVFNDKLIDILRKYGITGAAATGMASEIMNHGEQHFASGGRVGYAEGGAPDLPDAPWATAPATSSDDLPDAPWATPAPAAAPKEKSWQDTIQGAAGRLSTVPMIGPVANAIATVNPALVKEAATNVPHSAAEFAKNTVQPFLHPIDTATSIKNLGLGVLEKSGIMSGNEHEKYADAVGKFYADRYGGIENAKRAFATDPVGVAGDLSMLLTGGGSAAARLPGAVGSIGEAASAVGRSIDPLRAVAGAGQVAGRTAAEIAGVTTGAGGLPVRTAAQAGLEGGQAGQTFRENMRGQAPLVDAVTEARGAITNIRNERGNAYRQRMAAIGADKTIMSWNDVDTALTDMNKVATYKGQSLSPSTEAIRDKIGSAIADWKNLRASEFWTPEGFDALKKKVGDLRDSTQPHTTERLVADQAYNAIKKTIVDQAPEYAKAMKGYENASKMIKEIETTLSLKPNANIATSLRKLQQSLRDNVNTSFGRQTELTDFLTRAGAPLLMNRLAGQSLNSWVPRGLARVTGSMAAHGLPAAAVGAGAGLAPAIATAVATLPAMSPRLVGEVAHGVGRAARAMRPLAPVPRVARQIGQATTAPMSPFDNKSRNPYAP